MNLGQPTLSQPALGELLRAQRRRRRLALRDLADEIGVSFNTLSRVERGHLPDLTNYERILSWLDAPENPVQPAVDAPTTALIARHLYADNRLKPEHASTIVRLVQDLYEKLATPTPPIAVHLRSGQTFLPEAGSLLAAALRDMHDRLTQESS
ncbi:helix-turn-helix domain-containing protein [Micromonospora sp. NPDC049891]|uniref:helix-turn-helix domain-containing protein n=1 Tax=Micromonospora sp. NPDC049891 TaxID=3155655 RepID=UPI0033F2AB49